MSTPRDLAQTVSRQFALTHGVFDRTLADLTQAESLVSPQSAGNCINWVAGHVTVVRTAMLGLLGHEGTWPPDLRARYGKGSAGILETDTALDLAEIVRIYDETQAPLLEALSEVAPERLDDPAPMSPSGDPDETVGSLLAALAFHESYHVGQLGLLRRMQDKDGVIACG